MLRKKSSILIKNRGGKFGDYFMCIIVRHPLFIFLPLIMIGCSRPKAFVLNDTSENKYFVSELINKAYKENQIEKCPLIVINGIPFEYNKNQDSIFLPFKKSDIISLNFLNINSSRIIYNEKENDGAIIITTKTSKHP